MVRVRMATLARIHAPAPAHRPCRAGRLTRRSRHVRTPWLRRGTRACQRTAGQTTRPTKPCHRAGSACVPPTCSKRADGAAAVEPLDGARRASPSKSKCVDGRAGWGPDRRRGLHRGHLRRLALGSVQRGPPALRGGVGTRARAKPPRAAKAPRTPWRRRAEPQPGLPARPCRARNARREAAGTSAAGANATSAKHSRERDQASDRRGDQAVAGTPAALWPPRDIPRAPPSFLGTICLKRRP